MHKEIKKGVTNGTQAPDRDKGGGHEIRLSGAANIKVT